MASVLPHRMTGWGVGIVTSVRRAVFSRIVVGRSTLNMSVRQMRTRGVGEKESLFVLKPQAYGASNKLSGETCSALYLP